MGVQRLGVSTPSTNTDTLIYTADYPFLASVIGTNLTTSTSLVDVWVVPTGVTQTSGYVYYAYQTDIPPSNTLETHKFALNIGDRVYVRSTQNTSFNLAGLRQVDIQLATGVTSFQTTAPTNPINGQVWVDGDGVAGTNISSLAGYNVQASSATQIPFTVQGATGQTADLQQWDNSAGTALAKVDSTGLMYSQQSPVVNRDGFNAGGKNYLINGGFDVWQRGTTWTGTPTANTVFYATSDRWFHAVGTGSFSSTFERVAAENSDSTYGIKFGRNSGAGNNAAPSIIGQAIESINSKRLAGKTVTLSFYAKTLSSFGNSMQVYLISGTGSDQSSQTIFGAGYTGASVVFSPGQAISATMTRYTFTGTVPSNANQLAVMFALYVTPTTAGSNEYVQMENIQLEIGSTATNFSRASGSIQGELAACQRYYVRLGGDSTYGIIGSGISASSTEAYFVIPFPVTMRTAPASMEFSTIRATDLISVNSAITNLAMTSTETTRHAARLYTGSTSGLTAYRPCFVSNLNSANGYIGFSAEL